MKTKLTAAILIHALALLSLALGQQPAPVVDPDAERILDKAAQAEGGDSVLSTLRTLRFRGSTYLSSSRLLGDVESIVKFPDKFRDTFQSSNGDTQTYGFDGIESWKRSTSGELFPGLPRVQLLLPAAQWRLRYKEASFVGQLKIGNHPAYVVRALLRGQTSSADYYYDPVNYLLMQVDTASKAAATTYRVSRFQDIDGLKVPREWSFGESHTVIESVKLNIEVDDKQFAKPK